MKRQNDQDQPRFSIFNSFVNNNKNNNSNKLFNDFTTGFVFFLYEFMYLLVNHPESLCEGDIWYLNVCVCEREREEVGGERDSDLHQFHQSSLQD